ncbi:MAG: dihydrofolate reductase family protein [Actinomycetota bacterium]|nr:dihydrofolate reductase family protein [Actinomycetota bacterium]
MKLSVTTFTSLDGVMQGPGGPEEDPSSGFRYGGWLVPFADDDMGRLIDATFVEADEILLGRTTYDMMQSYWSQVTDPGDAVATALNTLPKHVATHRPDTLSWANSHPITGDLETAVAALKERPGRELQVHGSHGLIQSLLSAGLVDQFNIWTFPVVVGEGKRFFGEGAVASSMRRLSTEITSTGVVVTSYEPAGLLEQQTFVVEDGKEAVRP